jgi:pyrimidine-nucleoside phosphorylase
MNESMMRHAIERKRDGDALAATTWESIIAAYMDGAVDDVQMASLLMACVWRGLDLEEASSLTRAMVATGATLTYPADMFVVDKHSSGGVGDIVSLVAVPIVAACGVRVAKLSGRALGHTGGTIDKLETIAGFETAMAMEDFVAQVEQIGCAIAAQTEAFVPADKRLYRLRDRTATVPCIGLIAASIVSKKVSGGAAAFVFDVKCGSAAFMRDPASATELARALVEISRSFGRDARAVVTDMNEPLGQAIGSGLEMIEAREFLRGDTDPRAREICLRIAAEMLELAGVDEPHSAAVRALENGSAYEKFVAMIEAQGGSISSFEALTPSEKREEVAATKSGFATRIDAVTLGHIAREMSAHDPGAGIIVHVRAGDAVIAGQLVAEVYGKHADSSAIGHAIEIGSNCPAPHPLVYATI